MKILVADKLSESALVKLKSLESTIRIEPNLNADTLPDAIGDTDILIVRSTKVKAAAIDAATSLSLIIRAGAGVNTIDVGHASSQGIHVANCPGKNADAVAELTLGLIIAADRRISYQAEDLRAGKWNKKEYSKADGLKDKTIGIIGYGSIGKAVAKRAKSFGISVVAWSRSLNPQIAKAQSITYCRSPLQLAGNADIISLHLAVAPETINLVNAEFLDAMKDGAILVNTSRGEIIDQVALEKAIDKKSLKVALDVYSDEPDANSNKFHHIELAKRITGTHHIGASTNQASKAIADETVRIVESYIQTGKPINQVNAQEKSPAPYKLVVRHFNRVGVLADILSILRKGNINIEEMENAIFSGNAAAVCTLKLDEKPTESVLKTINSNPDIIQASL